MHFIFENKKYRVQFTYFDGKFTGSRALRKINNKRITTFCEISVKVDNQWQGLAGSYCIRNTRDMFRKSIARRTSLSYCTPQLKNKLLREVIWQNYFDTHADYKDGVNF